MQMENEEMRKQVRRELLQELIKKMNAMIAQGSGDEPMEEEEMSAEAEPMEPMAEEQEEGAEQPEMEGAHYSDVAKNGAEPGQDPARVTSGKEHEVGNSALDQLKNEMEPGAEVKAKESLKDFLRGKKPSAPVASESVTVSLIGLGKQKPPKKEDKMPNFMKKGKGKK